MSDNNNNWSPFRIDDARSKGDTHNFHVYRAKKVDGEWKYDLRTYPRSLYDEPSLLLAYLRTIEQAEQKLRENSPSNQNTQSNWQGNSGMEDTTADSITGSLQTLRVGTSSVNNNPYNTPTSQSYNNSYYPSIPHRATTQHPNQLAHNNRYPGNYQQGGLTLSPLGPGAYGSPYKSPGLPSIPQYGGGFGPQIPSQAYGHAGQAGAAVLDPRRLRRSATSAPPEMSHLKGFKPVKPKNWRTFFKEGRVFKANYTHTTGPAPGSNNPFQAASSNNTFSEVLRFVVIRPHKHHSICLAIHTYQNQGTTARHARARDHVVVYTGDRIPPLVHGEDPVILQRPAIKVALEPKAEPLLPASRLNLARLHTIDHTIANVVVGKISSRNVELIKQYCVDVQGLFISPPTGPRPLPGVREDDEDEEEDEDDEDDD